MDQNRRVVVTGLGIISPLGCGLTASWQGAKEGKCGIGPITLYDTEGQKVKLAGEAHGFDAENYMDKREARKMDRCNQLAIAAAQEAFQMSGLDMEKEDPLRCGVLVSSGIGGLTTIQNECLKGNEKGWDRVSPYFIPMSIANMSAGHIAIQLGFQGMCSCSVTACASGTNAIGDAMRYIRHGYADVMLCGGTEASITPLGMGGFTSLKALCTNPDPARASIPFDKERSGFVMGEGGGVLLNQCPHQLDLLQWICGLPKTVQAFCQEGKWHDIEVEDDVTAYLQFANGATGVFVTTTGDAPGTNRFEVTGTLGKLVCENDKLTFWKLAQDEREFCRTATEGFAQPQCQQVEVETDGENLQHVGVLNAFAGKILHGTPLVAEGTEGLGGLTLSNAMHLSSWLGRAVDIPFDEELFLSELNKRRATSRKKESKDITFSTEGTY